MDTVNHFDWPQVAAIAGGALVCLMTLVGILLTVLLKRTKVNGTNGNGIVVQVRDIQNSIETKMDSIEDKIDQEIIDRKEGFELVTKGLDKVVVNFGELCERNQMKCMNIHRAEKVGSDKVLDTTRRLIEHIDKTQRRKWEQQELLNRDLVSKTNNR